MPNTLRSLSILFVPLSFCALLAPAVGRGRHAEELDRSPSDLTLLAGGKRALTANTTSNTCSLVDLESGKVLAEAPTGQKPLDVDVSSDGSRAVVTNWLSDSITVFQVSDSAIKPLKTIPAGDEPRGVTVTKDGARAYVALQGEDSVAVIDLAAGKVANRIEVGREPWHLALSPDEKRLVVGNSRSRTVTVIDTDSLKPLYEVNLRGHNVRQLAVSPDAQWAYVPHISERGFATSKSNIDNGWVIGNRLSRVPLTGQGPREAITLDTRGKAVGDVDGVAVTPDGQTVAVTAGGTHELLLLRNPLPFVAYGGPGDHIDLQLLTEPSRFRRIPLGGRPLGVEITGDGKRAVVANYLLNALQAVDMVSGEVKAIPLGGPSAPSLARKGEAIFYDANRSFNQWYSCGSCHVEGHTNGSSFDTFNDGSYETPKKTLSLRGVAHTGPWTWHGAKPDLRELVRDSMAKSMQGPDPADSDLDALAAFLKSLDFVPGMAQNQQSVKRGEALFNARGCNTCHAPPHYTSAGIFTVGLESPQDVHKGYNPPPLRGVGKRAPYLHDASARSLNEVLTKYHRPSQLTGKPDYTDSELADVIAFLKSL